MSDLRDVTETAVLEGMASVMVKGYAARRQRDRGRLRKAIPNWREIVKDIPELAAHGAIQRSPSPDGPLALGTVN